MTGDHSVSGAAQVATFIALVLLASISLLASFADWPRWGLVLSLLIATLKASLVLLFFMHLVEQRASSWLAMLAAVLFVLLLVVLTATDVATRNTVAARPAPSPEDSFYVR